MEYEANQNMKMKNLSRGYPFPYVVQYVTDVYTYLHFFHISLRRLLLKTGTIKTVPAVLLDLALHRACKMIP